MVSQPTDRGLRPFTPNQVTLPNEALVASFFLAAKKFPYGKRIIDQRVAT